MTRGQLRSLAASGARTSCFALRVRRLDALQVPDKEVGHAASAIFATHAVAAAGNDQQVEILAGLDQRVGQPHRRFRRHVVVHFADDQQQLALQPVRVVDVRALGVLRPDGIAHPLLVPRGLVHAVVVAAAGGDRHLVELRMEEHGAGGILPAGGGAIDADAGEIHVRILRGGGLHPQNAVGESGVLEVVPADVVKRLRAVGGAHAVDLHDDEAQVGQRRVPALCREGSSARTNPAVRRRWTR